MTGSAARLPVGQALKIDLQANAYGDLEAQLDLLCNPYGATNPYVNIDATSVTPPTAIDAPDSCSPPG